jgi:hypothetical protein
VCSVFGFAFSRFFDSRVAGVVVEAISSFFHLLNC